MGLVGLISREHQLVLPGGTRKHAGSSDISRTCHVKIYIWTWLHNLNSMEKIESFDGNPNSPKNETQ